MGLSDKILKGDNPRTIPAKFGLMCFSGFRGEDLNVILNQNMPNFHNLYKLAERNRTSQKTRNICQTTHCYVAVDKYKFLFLVTAATLNGGWGCRTQF